MIKKKKKNYEAILTKHRFHRIIIRQPMKSKSPQNLANHESPNVSSANAFESNEPIISN